MSKTSSDDAGIFIRDEKRLIGAQHCKTGLLVSKIPV